MLTSDISPAPFIDSDGGTRAQQHNKPSLFDWTRKFAAQLRNVPLSANQSDRNANPAFAASALRRQAGVRSQCGSLRPLQVVVDGSLGESRGRLDPTRRAAQVRTFKRSTSLFEYCLKELGFSEDEAYRRIEVARMARLHPAMLELLRVGTATLSTLALLKHHIEPGNASELLTLISGGARLTIDLPRSRRLVGITWTRPLLEHSGCVQSNGRPANPWSRKRRNRTASALHATKRHGQCSVRERTRQLAEIDKKDDA